MALSNRFVRLTAEQLEECGQAASMFLDEHINSVKDLGGLARAATKLEQHGFHAADDFGSLKADLEAAAQKQRQKQMPSGGSTDAHQQAPPSAAGAAQQSAEPPTQITGNAEGDLELAVPKPTSTGPTADMYNTLEALVEIAKQGDVKLVKGEYLVKVFQETTKPVNRQQDLPQDAFVPYEDLLKDDMEIVAISYCWCSKEHPDPNRFHLPTIAKMTKATMAGQFVDGYIHDRLAKAIATDDLRKAGFRFGSSSVAVLWDFMSLPQVKRSEVEQSSFKRGLLSMNAWYGSKYVTKWVLTDLPDGAPRASYSTSGWTFFEREVANIISPPWRMLTLARGKSAFKLLDEKKEYSAKDYIHIAHAAFEEGKRQQGGPMVPQKFDEHLEGLTFTNGTDKEAVRPKYHESFRLLVEGATTISFRNYGMTTQAAEEALQVVVTHCHQMAELDLAENRIWEGQLDTLAAQVAVAACCRTLTTLNLYNCKQVSGDIACLAPLVHLATLNLYSTKVSGDVAGLAPLIKLVTLNLSDTEVSGDVQGLAPLVDLQELNLWATQASGDVQGLAPLVDLRKLCLSDTQVLGEVAGLAPLTKLVTLYLDRTKVSGGVFGLAPFVNLETLSVYDTQVLGEVAGLAPLTKLVTLYINESKVSGDVFGLAPLVNLATLFVMDTQVCGDYEALKKQLPKLRDFRHD